MDGSHPYINVKVMDSHKFEEKSVADFESIPDEVNSFYINCFWGKMVHFSWVKTAREPLCSTTVCHFIPKMNGSLQ